MKLAAKAGMVSFICVGSALSVSLGLCAYYLSAGSLPFNLFQVQKQEHFETNSAVVLRQLQKQFKIIAASSTAETVVRGFTQSQVPLSRDELIYWAFFNVNVDIDLSQVKDSDFYLAGKTVYIVLPNPQLEIALDLQKSRTIMRNTQFLSGPSQDKDLTTKLQAQAQSTVLEELEKDGSLKSEAMQNAQTQISNYFAKLGFATSFRKHR